jgi:surface polysaccharide O-acyltransferase-like enzyme
MARRLLLLNGLAIIGTVVNHTIGWGYVAMFFWTHRYLPVTSPNFDQLGSLSYYGLRFFEQLIIPAIPAFLFVSGFFVAFASGKGQAGPEPSFIRSRLRYLIIPYLLWSVIMLAFEAAQGEIYTPLDYLRKLLLGQTTSAFYFVPLLAQLYILSPWLSRLARDRWKVLLAVTAGLQILVYGMQYGMILIPGLDQMPFPIAVTSGWFILGNAFWFSFGIVAGFHQSALKAWLVRARWLLLGLTVVLLFAAMLEWEALVRLAEGDWIGQRVTLLDGLYCLGVLSTFLAFDRAKFPLTRQLNELGARSFGIYLVHSLVLIIVSRAVYHFAPWMLGVQILFQPLLFVAGLGIPLALMAFVRRTPANRVYSYQFG